MNYCHGSSRANLLIHVADSSRYFAAGFCIEDVKVSNPQTNIIQVLASGAGPSVKPLGGCCADG